MKALEEIFKALEAHYDENGDDPDYPENDVFEAIRNIEYAISHISCFDWEQHAYDLRHNGIEEQAEDQRERNRND